MSGESPSWFTRRRIWRLLEHLFRGVGIAYIALIGIFAIEELQRREKVLATIIQRQVEVAAALSMLNTAQGDAAVNRRTTLEREAAALRGLHGRTTALILGGAIRPEKGPPGTIKAVLCELTALASPEITCGNPQAEAWSLREILATVALKRPAEQRSSGDVFAVLIIVAALGGALISLYLDGESDSDWVRKLFRAVGGGTVCYLALTAGTVPFTSASLTTFGSPAMGSLLGLLSGMFSTKVFQLLSNVVDSWLTKVTPKATAAPEIATAVAHKERPPRVED